MRVILLENVSKIGKQYEIKEVKDGFARNFLLAQKKAVLATPQTVKLYEGQKERAAQDGMVQAELANKVVETLKDTTLTMTGPASEEGHFYAGVDAEQIAKAAKDQAKIDLSADGIILEKPLKEIGEHIVKLNLAGAEGEVKVVLEKAKE